MGGTFRMLSGEEKIVPSFIEKMYLTSLWRLHTSPIRRILRLFLSLIKLIYFNKNIYSLDSIKFKKFSK